MKAFFISLFCLAFSYGHLLPVIKDQDITTLLTSGVKEPYAIAFSFYTSKTDDSQKLLAVVKKTEQTIKTLKPHIALLHQEIKKPENKTHMPILTYLLGLAQENLSLMHQLHDLFWSKNPGSFWNLIKLKSIVSPPLAKLGQVELKLNELIRNNRSQLIISALNTSKATAASLRTTVGTNLTRKMDEFKKKLTLIGNVRTKSVI